MLTSSQLAALLNVSRGRIHQLTRSGVLPATRVGRLWLYTQQLADQLANSPIWPDGTPRRRSNAKES